MKVTHPSRRCTYFAILSIWTNWQSGYVPFWSTCPSSHLTKITDMTMTMVTLGIIIARSPWHWHCAVSVRSVQLTQEARLLQHLVNLSHSTQQTRAHSHSLQFMNWKNFKLFNKWHNVLHKVLKFSPPLATVIALVTWFSAKTDGNECI